MRPKGHTNVLSFNIGTYETAPARRDAYIRAAKKAGFWSLGGWCRAVLDKSAKHKAKERRGWNLIAGLLIFGYLFSPRPGYADCWKDALAVCGRQPDLCDLLFKVCQDPNTAKIYQDSERRAAEQQAASDQRTAADDRRRLEAKLDELTRKIDEARNERAYRQ